MMEVIDLFFNPYALTICDLRTLNEMLHKGKCCDQERKATTGNGNSDGINKVLFDCKGEVLLANNGFFQQ